MASKESLITPPAMTAHIRSSLPRSDDYGEIVEEVSPGRVLLRLVLSSDHFSHDLPQGSSQRVLSGPMMMGLTDTAMYGAVHSLCGPGPLVTIVNLNFEFLRLLRGAELLVDASVLRTMENLHFLEAHLKSKRDSDDVAQATATYAVWPSASRNHA